MLTYIVKRLLQVPLVVFGVSIIIFFLIHISPVDPAYVLLGESGTQEQAEQLSEAMGLNRSLPLQYFTWISNALRGNLGIAMMDHQPVSRLLFEKFPATLRLMIGSMIVAVCIAFPLGIVAAIWRNSWTDFGARTFALLGISTPEFWFGMILILVVAYYWDWLPSGGGNSLIYVILPSFALGFRYSGLIARLVRSNLLDTLSKDYITTARAKGNKERTVIFKHAMKNTLIPVITIIGLQIGYLLGGTVAIEAVFAYPGLGQLTWTRMLSGDYPVILGSLLFFSLFFSIVNLVTDLSYAFVDPRIRYG
ncbi:ABC transporter permease [Candidatus Bipolaricaulota bacterium]